MSLRSSTENENEGEIGNRRTVPQRRDRSVSGA